MKRIFAILLALALLMPPSPAQDKPLTDSTTENLPEWLVKFSNLPRKEREQYLQAFNNAKTAYQNGQWVICISYLADCEIIFRHNPNVWNLRACCLMEQKYFEEAERELLRLREAVPDDPVTIMNLANLHLASGRYQECIDTISALREKLPEDTPGDLIYVLDFRHFLSLVMMGKREESKKLLKGLTPMSDTPLYYYGQIVYAMVDGNQAEVSRNLRIVNNIFAKSTAIVPYQRAMELSGIANKRPNTPAGK